jgi:hypothetical protein
MAAVPAGAMTEGQDRPRRLHKDDLMHGASPWYESVCTRYARPELHMHRVPGEGDARRLPRLETRKCPANDPMTF